MRLSYPPPPAVPGSGLLGWTAKHWPDQLTPTALDTPHGASLPDTDLRYCRHSPVLCDLEAMAKLPHGASSAPSAAGTTVPPWELRRAARGYCMKRSTEGRGEELRASPLLPCTFFGPHLCPSCAPCLRHLSHSSLQLQPTWDSSLLQEVFLDALLPSQ